MEVILNDSQFVRLTQITTAQYEKASYFLWVKNSGGVWELKFQCGILIVVNKLYDAYVDFFKSVDRKN